MINKIILIIFVICTPLFGCNKYMTNDEVIKECKKCEAANMEPRIYAGEGGFSSGIIRVDCYPKINKGAK